MKQIIKDKCVRNMKKSWAHFYNKEITLKEFLGNYYTVELFDEIIKLNPKRILEVGSGTGVMGILLSHLGYDVVSTDNDKDVLELAKRNNTKFNGSVKFEFVDAFKTNYKSKEFDVAYSQGFYEHFNNKDIKRLLDEQLRISKYVIISVPNKYYPEYDYGNERLISTNDWVRIFKKMNPKLKIRRLEYQFMLRKNKPFKTIFNLLTGREVMSLFVIRE